LAGGASGELFGTQDGGEHWRVVGEIGGAVIRHIVFDPQHLDTVYVGTSKGIFKRAAGGAVWLAVNMGLRQLDIQALAIDPLSPAVIYAASNGGGVHRSSDGGLHWLPLSEGLIDPFIQTIAFDPQAPATLYAGGRSGRIFRSDDAGLHWRIINSGADLPPITVLAVDPVAPRRVYAATAGNSVVVETQISGWARLAGLIALIVVATALLRNSGKDSP
ncbi:MAG: hypothetical protein PHG21_06160, partial [Azoarcus sp.]|nr:hypothetical protein [Azoarcus sp.]